MRRRQQRAGGYRFPASILFFFMLMLGAACERSSERDAREQSGELAIDFDGEGVDQRRLLLDDAIHIPDELYERIGVRREDEVTTRRSKHSYTFQRSDGSFVVVISAGQQNYLDASGKWLPIDPGPELIHSSYSAHVWPGNKEDTGPVNFIGNGGSPPQTYRSVFRFPLDSVPPTAVLTGVILQLAVTHAEDSHSSRIGRVSTDPQLADGDQISLEIEGGTEYAAGSPICEDTGIRVQPLDGALADVQEQALSGGWIGLGLKHASEQGNTRAEVSSANASPDEQPRLILTYGGWTSAADMHLPRDQHGATLLTDGRLLISGGFGTAASEVWDPSTGIWTPTGAFDDERFTHTATLLKDGRVLVAGGWDGSVTRPVAQAWDPATGLWSPAGSLAQGRAGHAAHLLLDGRVLITGGYSASDGLASSEVWDPSTETWTSSGTMATTRRRFASVRLQDGRVLVIGGHSGSYLSSCEIWDPVTETWSPTGDLAIARHQHTATLLADGRVLVAGGQAITGALSSAEIWDPATETWSPAASMTARRVRPTAALLPSGHVLIVTGRESDALYHESSEIWNPATDSWAPMPSMQGGRYVHTTTVLPDGRVVAVGGYDGVTELANVRVWDPGKATIDSSNDMIDARHAHVSALTSDGEVLIVGGDGWGDGSEIWDPNTESWSDAGSLFERRESHTATALPSGEVLVAGGFGGSGMGEELSTAELWDPISGWGSTGSLAEARHLHAASLLPDGRVMVSGGQDYLLPRASVELWDPQTEAWSYSGSLQVGRWGHTSTLLTDGRVLVAGGSNDHPQSGGDVLDSAELWDPFTEQWISTDTLSSPRHKHSATLLADGRVLVAGGAGGGTAVEVWDPGTGTWSLADSLGTARQEHSATLLPDGRVMVGGGWNSSEGHLDSTEIWDPATGTWSIGTRLQTGRSRHTADLLTDGRVLLAGGNGSSSALSSVEIWSPNIVAAPACAPTLTSLPAGPWTPGGAVTVTGTGLTGCSESTGGNGHASSPTNYPLVRLVSLANGHVWGPSYTRARDWSASEVTFTVPDAPGVVGGAYFVQVVTNGVPSSGVVAEVAAVDPGDPETPASIIEISGAGQSATVDATLPDPLVVEVRDALGVPVPGVAVSWAASGDAAVSAAGTTTGASGQTSVTATLGTIAGGYTYTATVDGTTLSTSFGATADAGAAASVAVVSGDDQSGPVDTQLVGPLVVVVKDGFDNVVEGELVRWTASGDAAVSAAETTTGANGQTSVTAMLGTIAGEYAYTATLGATALTTSFDATAEATGAVVLSVSGIPSPIAAGTPASVTIEALDQYGNTASGYAGTITFTSSDGAAELPADHSLSSGDGLVTLPGVVLETFGAHSVTATDMANPTIAGTQAGIEVTPAAADHVTITAATDTAVAGETVELFLGVLDAFGNSVSEAVTVELVATGSAGGLPSIDGRGSPSIVHIDSSGTGTADLVGATAEVVTVLVGSATDGGGTLLPEMLPHGEVEILLVAADAHRAILIAPEETIAGRETPVAARLVDEHGNFTGGEVEVCVTATGGHGGEPAMGPDALPSDPSTACATTAQETGTASLTFMATKAETVHLLAESSGLPGSGGDDTAEVLVLPADPNHLRLTAEAEEAYACLPLGIEVQVADVYDNPARSSVLATISVDSPSAPEGEARIVEAELSGVDTDSLPSAEVTGETDGTGLGRIEVALDAHAALEVSWASAALEGDPSERGLTITFTSGPASATLSELDADRSRVSSGRTTGVSVRPLDDCGLEVGPGADVVLDDPGPAGTLSMVTDEGDGSYTALFTATGCPMTAEIGAEVEGVRLERTAVIETVCLEAHPDLSRVTTVEDEVPACASEGVGAPLAVVLLDGDGEDLGPDFPVEIEEDPPYIVEAGERSIEVDPETGLTTHLLLVGSDRCSDQPRSVHVNAGGVRLTDVAHVVFTCPEVDPVSAIYSAVPERAPASGDDAVRIHVFAGDICGNPAFGREASIEAVNTLLDARVRPESEDTGDDPNSDRDGTASFELTSLLAGETGVVAEVDGVRMEESEPDLVVFDLQDVLSLGYETNVDRVVAGQRVSLTATLTNRYGADLTDVRLEMLHDGLTTLLVEGVKLEADGSILLPRLDAGEARTVRAEAQVIIGSFRAVSRLHASYKAEGVREPNTSLSDEVVMMVEGHQSAGGCDCGSAGGAPPRHGPALFALLLLGAWLLPPRRRPNATRSHRAGA